MRGIIGNAPARSNSVVFIAIGTGLVFPPPATPCAVNVGGGSASVISGTAGVKGRMGVEGEASGSFLLLVFLLGWEV